MRTTLTLDPDVVAMLSQETHRRRRPYKQVVNDAIRRGLAPGRAAEPQAAYRVDPHQATLVPGLDRTAFNKYADELEDSAIVGKSRKARKPRGARGAGK